MRELTNDLTGQTKRSVCGTQRNCAVLFNGGSYHAGGKIHVMKVAIKPGKPLTVGTIGKTIYIGLPGNPVASFVNCLLIADPIIRKLAGMETRQPQTCAAVADFDRTRRLGRQEYVPAQIVQQSGDDPLRVRAFQKAGSATLMPLARADGLVVIPADCAEVKAGDPLKFMPFPDASPR